VKKADEKAPEKIAAKSQASPTSSASSASSTTAAIVPPVVATPPAKTPASPPVAPAVVPVPTPAPATPAPSIPAAVPATPAPAPPPAPPVAPAASAAPADPVDKLKPPFRNGTFSGWGTSRHGDIQATVEIQDGWIISATISQCLTQYSCSWIAALVPQVTVRQSPEVDFVTGATQSSNAFYGALVQALTKAK
jgi:uncharacterized protein with FMN-binding domain